MACLFAGVLARSGRVAVTMAGTWRHALAMVAHYGVMIDDGQATWSAPVRVLLRDLLALGPGRDSSYQAEAVPSDTLPGSFTPAMVLVKSYQTLLVARWLRVWLAPDDVAISLQNGLGNGRRLVRILGRRRVVIGVTDCGATLLGPGRVRVGGLGPTILEGRPDQGWLARRMRAMAELLTAAGLECTLVEDIRPAVFRKLAVNCAINANAALRGVPNGELLDDPQAAASLRRAAREVGAVAKAMGVRLDGDPAEAAVEVAQRTAANRCSMLYDLDRGAPTEIESLNGAVVRLGRRCGVPTPENELLWRAVRAAAGGKK